MTLTEAYEALMKMPQEDHLPNPCIGNGEGLLQGAHIGGREDLPVPLRVLLNLVPAGFPSYSIR